MVPGLDRATVEQIGAFVARVGAQEPDPTRRPQLPDRTSTMLEPGYRTRTDGSGHRKALARELDVPVVAVSQLNRALEARNDKRPQLGDLRESGAIEQDADAVLMIYRDEYYNPYTLQQGIAEINIAKQRAEPTGIIKTTFADKYTRFDNLPYGYTNLSSWRQQWRLIESTVS